MLRQLAPVVATSVVVLFLLVSAIPLLHWFQADNRNVAYQDNRALWRELGLESYRFSLEMTCDCGELPPMPVRVVIDDGEPISSIDFETIGYEQSSVLPLSIDAVFDIARAGVVGDHDDVLIDYDTDYGFPRSIVLDPDADRTGDETSVRIVDFDPRAANSRELR